MGGSNIFAFCGSMRNDSTTQAAISLLIESLMEKINVSNIYCTTPATHTIRPCTGCQRCFNEGVCPLCDDINQIKNYLNQSQIIILASPVYMHNVSGQTKVFIDRISYWSHLFQLRGKIGVTINTSASNGNVYVAEYLAKVLSSMGCSVVCNISITTSGLNDKSLQSIISVNSRRIAQEVEKSSPNLCVNCFRHNMQEAA